MVLETEDCAPCDTVVDDSGGSVWTRKLQRGVAVGALLVCLCLAVPLVAIARRRLQVRRGLALACVCGRAVF